MDNFRFGALMSICVLASCGTPADDPKTIPVSGKWTEEAKLMSLSVNGMAIDPSKVPQMNEILAKYRQSGETCGEPLDLNEQQFQEKMGGDKFANCTIDSRNVNGNRISETASCEALNLPGVTDRVRFTSQTVQQPDKVVSNMSIKMTGQDQKSGARALIKIEMRGTMTRVGDC